ncbi:hypothetical protein [Paenibacillus sedimenti]|uniref:Uncharacterized protein n=1 Tax=Paenibacillus sedimenti TaxID=2770274 RepID=A0A926QLB9_9BACL|nr:hypothetical protein [Paenibacillus sedimenti]MBD0382422.1 hypothetical protein [Paenibacillus sedimenti]
MSIASKKKASHKVLIMLKDHDALGRVYVELQGKLSSKELMVEALQRLQDGLIYADEECTELIDGEYIEISSKKGASRKEDDFVFLIDRTLAEDYIVAAKIIK